MSDDQLIVASAKVRAASLAYSRAEAAGAAAYEAMRAAERAIRDRKMETETARNVLAEAWRELEEVVLAEDKESV